MKALCLKKIGKLELVDAPVPDIQSNQVLIRTGSTTICTSDLADIRENENGATLPGIIGHEGAGTVVKVGSAVKNFSVGDRLACHPVHPCGQCPTCLRGLDHLCTAMGHFGINMPGTFAEYFVVREDRARLIPEGIPFATAALAEPICVCLEALEQARLTDGEHLLIMGDGPFGVLMARLAQNRKLGRLAIAGERNFRLSHAGDAEQINVKEKKITGKFDAVILAVSSAAAAEQCLSLLSPRGRLVVFAALPREGVKVDLMHVHMKELEIVGACNDLDLFDCAMAILPEATPLVTHHFALTDYKKAFDLAENGRDKSLKIAFDFAGANS